MALPYSPLRSLGSRLSKTNLILGRFQVASRKKHYSSASAPGVRIATETEAETAGSTFPWLRHAGGLVLTGALGLAVGSTLDDLLIYRQCSSEARVRALENKDLRSILGNPLQVGPWYKATLAVSPSGKSVSITLPLEGNHSSGSLHLRSLRVDGGKNTLLYNTFGSGQWTLMTLEASFLEGEREDNSEEKKGGVGQRLDLMPKGNLVKLGDSGRGECGPCKTTAVSEV